MQKETEVDFAVSLLSDWLGPHTAEAYRRVYTGRSIAEIRGSLMRVLGEYLGGTEANFEVEHFDSFVKARS